MTLRDVPVQSQELESMIPVGHFILFHDVGVLHTPMPKQGNKSNSR